jgi:hypothetical protein
MSEVVKPYEIILKKKIQNQLGDVYHYIQSSDLADLNIEEIYISCLLPHQCKAWKLNKKQTNHLLILNSDITIRLYNEESGQRDSINIRQDDKANKFIIIRPNTWYGFFNYTSNLAYILNATDIPHSPEQSLTKNIEEINFAD